MAEKITYGIFLLDKLPPNKYLGSEYYAIERLDLITVGKIYEGPMWKTTDFVKTYADTIRNSRETEIEYPVKPTGQKVYRTLPRAAYTFSVLALNERHFEIDMLLSTGAKPDEEFIKWVYGEESRVWEYLHEIWIGFQERNPRLI